MEGTSKVNLETVLDTVLRTRDTRGNRAWSLVGKVDISQINSLVK